MGRGGGIPDIQHLHGAAGRRPIIPCPRSGRRERRLRQRLAPPQKEDEKMHDHSAEKSVPPKRSLRDADDRRLSYRE